MGAARNVVFVVVAALVLSCVLVYKVADLAVPGVEAPARSALEGRAYQQLPDAGGGRFASGAFQDDFERFVADALPARDAVLMASARLQRAGIASANAAFGYDAYPTFFGSGYAYSPRLGTVSETPESAGEADMGGYERAAGLYARVMERNVRVSWGFHLVDRPSTTAALPAHALVSDPLDYARLREVLAARLPASCVLTDGAYVDEDAYLADYFRTDHHWRTSGGYAAYGDIARAFGRTVPQAGGESCVYSGPFWGSAARNGACLPQAGDAVYDIACPLDGVSVRVDGKPRGARAAYRREGKGRYKKPGRFANVYAGVFHGDYGLLELEREGGDGPDGTLLVVGDSYTNCMERYFLQSYRKVVVIDPRHYDGTLQEYLDGHEVDDAVFILSKNNLAGDAVQAFLELP